MQVNQQWFQRDEMRGGQIIFLQAHPLASSIVSARSVVEVGPLFPLTRSFRMSLASILIPGICIKLSVSENHHQGQILPNEQYRSMDVALTRDVVDHTSNLLCLLLKEVA
jgi:hypothetical protein